MKNLLENYKKIKKLQFFAKQTFLDEKGMEIMPTLENLMGFKEELNKIMRLLNQIEEKLYALPSKSED